MRAEHRNWNTLALADPGGNPAMPPKAQEGAIMSFPPPQATKKPFLFYFIFESESGFI